MTEPTRILRLIARLNIGGPAIQAITLTRELEQHGFETLLVKGVEGEREGTMDGLAERLGVTPVLVPTLHREVRPMDDLRTLVAVRRMIRDYRPAILHTHTAKAGTIGRLAAMLAGRRRPRLVVHTFHGHVLSGYFSKRAVRIYTMIERFLASRTDVLIAVSDEVRDDLVELGIAPAERIRVVHLGFDLARFDLDPGTREAARSAMRGRLSVAPSTPLVTLVARLVPIKRVDVFLAAARIVTDAHPDVRFCIAGDGELGDELRSSPDARALADRVVWPGFVDDMPGLYAASDIVVLTSDNEGTPVSLIEALAAGIPVVGTRVGGVPTVVDDEQTGLLAAPGDAGGVAERITQLLDDPGLAHRLARDGRLSSQTRFDLKRLVSDINATYCDGVKTRDPIAVQVRDE